MKTRGALLLSLALAPCPPAVAGDAVVETELSVDAFRSGEPALHGWLRVAPRVTRRLSPRVLLTVAPVLEADSHGDLDREPLYDDAERAARRAPLRFERLSLRFDLGAVTLEAGKQPLTWGRTDAINATDNLTPRDWTDPLHEVRLSPWAVRLKLEKARWEAELALVPRYAPSRLPRLDGRWAPIAPVRVANPLFPLAGPPRLAVETTLLAPDLPATTFDNLQAGVRAGRRGARGEWTISYFEGFDDAPRFDLAVGDPDPAAGTLPVVLTPRFPRLEVVGADGVLLAGAWALRAEAGSFRFPEGRDPSFVLWEADAEWTRGAWQLVLGYADASGAGSAGGSPPPSTTAPAGGAAPIPLALDLAFVPAAFLRLARSLFTEWEAAIEAIVGTERGDHLVRLSGSWPASDVLRLGAEIDLVDGPEGSFFGAWRDNDRLRLFVRITH